jgi:hypothetical protein
LLLSKTPPPTNVGEEPSYTAGGNANYTTTLENNMEVF